MKIPMMWMALALTSAALAQSHVDRAFTASGTQCDQVTWSPESLAKYPRIASACQAVMQREGKYYVKFSGEVRRVANRGQQLTVAFKNGDQLTLTPPANLSLSVNGKPTPISSLRPGDQLTFYVPGDQLSADFFEGDNTAATVQEVPIAPAPERVAQATPEPAAAPATTSRHLPRTGSVLPLVGLVGVMLVTSAGVLSARRRWGSGRWRRPLP